jgi:hypothetical protein
MGKVKPVIHWWIIGILLIVTEEFPAAIVGHSGVAHLGVLKVSE